MKKRELEFVLQEGEGWQIEFKESPHHLEEVMVAFANASGGRIFVGVDDQGKIKGLALTNRLKSQIQDAARNCDPSLEIEMQQAGGVLVITVPESSRKPHRCASGFYIRQGPNTQKLSQKEIVEFIFSEGKKKFDSLPSRKVSLKDLDKGLVREFLRQAGIEDRLPLKETLINLGVVADEKGTLNNAGVLFFCLRPKKYLIQAYVTCARYLGTKKVDILDRADFEGNLVSQIDEAVKFVQRNTRLRYEIKDIQRKEIPEYPLAAIREAITNAVMHRDYFETGAHVQVDIYDDKIEIVNIGSLIKPLTLKTLGTVAVRRNPLIADLLHRIRYVEKMGTGIRRIKEACQKHDRVAFSVEADGIFISRFTLEKTGERVGEKVGERVGEKVGERDTERVTENQRKILEEIKRDVFITAVQLAQRIGISTRKVEINIAKLKHKGMLQRIGPDKGGHWEVKG